MNTPSTIHASHATYLAHMSRIAIAHDRTRIAAQGFTVAALVGTVGWQFLAPGPSPQEQRQQRQAGNAMEGSQFEPDRRKAATQTQDER